MWLSFGVDVNGEFISIQEVPRGKTSLLCPYCGEWLTAKKGNIKEHHFAHAEQTCHSVKRSEKELPTLPLYNHFSITLSGKELLKLQQLWKVYGCKSIPIYSAEVLPAFTRERLLEFNTCLPLGGGYQFTNLGKIPVGALPLAHFNSVQEPLLLKKLQVLEQKAERAKLANLSTLNERLKDVQIYRAQLKRLLSTTLYYLKIRADEQTFYKIGVTQRSIEERVQEVQYDLSSHHNTVKIDILGTWDRRGNVEKYFKYRFRNFNYLIGNLTEYFRFKENDAQVVLRELERIKPKELTDVERDILEGKLSA